MGAIYLLCSIKEMFICMTGPLFPLFHARKKKSEGKKGLSKDGELKQNPSLFQTSSTFWFYNNWQTPYFKTVKVPFPFPGSPGRISSPSVMPSQYLPLPITSPLLHLTPPHTQVASTSAWLSPTKALLHTCLPSSL